jgi:hypothetical protein
MAGKEKRDMEALFGKKPAAPATSTAKKFERGSAALPTMFANSNSKTGGLNTTMKQEHHSVFDATTGGAKAGKSVSGGGVSKMNMGSHGVMDNKTSVFDPTTGGAKAGKSTSTGVSKLNMGSHGVMDNRTSAHVDVANRAGFAQSSSSKAGAPQTVNRGPNSQAGVLRKMPWE